MDINNKKYKRKLSDRDPQDQFEGEGDSCADNGREMYPKMKQRKRKRLFGQEVGVEDTLCRTAGTDKDNHTHKHRHKKKKSVTSLQVDLQVEDSVKSREQNPPLQEGGRHPVEKESSCELRSGKSLDLSGAQEMIGTRNSKRRRNKKRKKGLQAQESGVGREAALQYLHLWDNNRSHWCFRKKAQFWLLQNMYEEDKVMTMCAAYSQLGATLKTGVASVLVFHLAFITSCCENDGT